MFKSVYAKELTDYYELRQSVLSKSSLVHEKCYLKRFDEYLSSVLSKKQELTEELIDSWIHELCNRRSSIENEVVIVRQFLRYLNTIGVKNYIPVIPKVHDDYTPYIFSDDELSKIFELADNTIQKSPASDPYLAIELPVILRLLFSSGLRIGETLLIKKSDVDLENGILRLLNTKGDKQRLVPVTNEMNDILKKYCSIMSRMIDTEWLFPSSKREGPISDRSVKHRFEYILEECNIHLENRSKFERGPCLHCFRHVFAFKSFAQNERNGRGTSDTIPFLSIYFGHVSLNETAKYLKFSNEIYPEAITDFGTYMEDLLPEVVYDEE